MDFLKHRFLTHSFLTVQSLFHYINWANSTLPACPAWAGYGHGSKNTKKKTGLSKQQQFGKSKSLNGSFCTFFSL
jgi:hypothetical protein